MERVTKERRAHVEGVEKRPELVSRCIERHLIVHQGDLLDGLDQYSKGSFDMVLLLGTLQELIDPQMVLREAFRVGRQVVISYSNFAYWRVRLQLLLSGRAPVTRALPSAWYRTSNMHFFSILDFETFCREMGMQQVRKACFSPAGRVEFVPNLRSEYALALLESEAGGLLQRYRADSTH
jgi:methionine biosynthesis protein MetW